MILGEREGPVDNEAAHERVLSRDALFPTFTHHAQLVQVRWSSSNPVSGSVDDEVWCGKSRSRKRKQLSMLMSAPSNKSRWNERTRRRDCSADRYRRPERIDDGQMVQLHTTARLSREDGWEEQVDEANAGRNRHIPTA